MNIYIHQIYNGKDFKCLIFKNNFLNQGIITRYTCCRALPSRDLTTSPTIHRDLKIGSGPGTKLMTMTFFSLFFF